MIEKNIKIDPYFERYRDTSIKQSKVSEKRCVCWSRVSSKEQLLGDSLKVQHNACTAFAVKKGFSIIEYFGNTHESAKEEKNRKEFNKMLSFVFEPKNKIDAIIVFSYDRFSRSGLAGIEIISQLLKHDVKVYSAINGLDPDSLEGKLMLVITLLQANIQNVNKSIDTKRKMESKLRDGKWVHMLSIGYSREEKTKEIKVNDEGRLIQEGMKLFLKGYTMEQVRKTISSKGLPVSLKKWGEILRNPFYCGVMISITVDNEPILGTHEPLISQKEFKTIQEKLETKGKTSSIDLDAVNGLALKGLARCSKCSSRFSGYLNKKKQLYYYICANRDCRSNVSAKQMNEAFIDYLESLIPSSNSKESFEKQLVKFLRELIALNNDDLIKTEEQLKSVKSKINLLADKLLEQVITDEIFNEKLEELNIEKTMFLRKLELLENVSSNPDEIARIVRVITSKSSSIYSKGTFYQRKELVESVFQSNFFYDKDNRTFRTFSNSKITELIKRLSGSYTCREDIKKAESFEDSAFG